MCVMAFLKTLAEIVAFHITEKEIVLHTVCLHQYLEKIPISKQQEFFLL